MFPQATQKFGESTPTWHARHAVNDVRFGGVDRETPGRSVEQTSHRANPFSVVGLRYTVPAMAIRPLPGEVLEHLPRGIDESQISHHVPLRGGPDGLLGETHLLLFHGELVVLTRGSSKAAFRRLDLDPEGRAMLLAESWSVQLSLPTRDAATCFEVSSKDVATVLALISAVKPGQHTDEAEADDTDAVADPESTHGGNSAISATAVEPLQHAPCPQPSAPAQAQASAPVQARVARSHVRAPAQASAHVQANAARSHVQMPAQTSAPVQTNAARSQVQTSAPVQATLPSAVVQSMTVPHREPVQPTTSLRDAFAASEAAERDLAAAPTSEPKAAAFDDDLNLDIDLENDLESRPGALASAASSVRDIAASFRGAAASLRSAASSLRRSRELPDDDDDDASLTIDIDDVFADDDFHGVDAPVHAEAAPEALQPPQQQVAPARVIEAASLSPAPSPRTAPAGGLRFNFDDLPTPASTDSDTAETLSPTEAETNVSLAEFFDRHVPPTQEVVPSRRRRMVPAATATTAPAATAKLQTPLAPQRIPGTPQISAPTPVAPPPAIVSMPTPVAPPIPVVQVPTPTPVAPPRRVVQATTPTPVAPAPSLAARVCTPTPVAPLSTPLAEAEPRDDRHLVNPRWAKGARRSATAAASAATTAASATATAASAAVGRARVAANRLLDRQRSRSGRPRMNRRRLGSTGGRPTVTIAAALMAVALLIYWVLPSGEITSVDTGSSTPNSGLSAEIASEIRERQASALPAAIGMTPLAEESSDAEAVANAEAQAAEAAAISDRNFYDVATLTPESPQPELLALKECRPLAERGLLVRVKVEIDEPTGTVPEVWVGDSSMDRELRQCISRQFKKATFVPKIRGGKLIKPRLKLNF